MSDVIKLLPDSVANQIAAGEVIQRPASVIKELVENSIDAGAKTISIIIKDAGRTLIQVIDDGCGMTDTDARMSFERHATSKITKADDLYTLHTMGFRGEALPSIAAVSQIDLRTMPHGATLGTRLIINGSRVESQEPEACAPGTNMMVKNLFFNIPVRRKFLKKDSVELSNILREFERLSLVNTGVEFSISHNDVTLHHLLPQPLKRRIIDLFGKTFEHQLIPLETDTSIVSINGYIGLPEHARRRGHLQYMMVNGRNMRHPYFHKAIMQCYADLIPQDRQPNYFINFNVDPETIDVNIHPTKNEIKFENEQAIWQILTASIRESLSRYNVVQAIDFDNTDAPEIPPFNPDVTAGHELEVNTSFNPFDTPDVRRETSRDVTSPTQYRPTHRRTDFTDWEKLYADFNSKLNEETPVEDTADIELKFEQQFTSTGTMQIKNRYIVTPAREGLMIIDQHRAHVTVLFEKYMSSLAGSDLQSQQVMFPETVALSPSQSATLEGVLSEVVRTGFGLEHDDSNNWTITAVPAVLTKLNPMETLLKIIDDVSENGSDISDGIYRRIALSMAVATAVRSEQPLSVTEREELLASLLSLPNPGYTPDGLPTMTTMSLDEIASRM